MKNKFIISKEKRNDMVLSIKNYFSENDLCMMVLRDNK